MTKLKNIILALGLAASGVVQQSLPAKALTAGTPITGALNIAGTNYYDPAKGFVPNGQGYENASDAYNSVTVPLSNSAVEFGFQDGVNTDTSNFTTTGLTIQDVSSSNSIPITYSFTDSEFAPSSFVKTSDTFPGGVSYSLSDNTFTVNTPSLSSAGTYAVQFQSSQATAVPEPSEQGIVVLGLPLFLGIRAIKKRKGVTRS